MDRRQYLREMGVGAVAALAGCADLLGYEPDENEGGRSTGTPTDAGEQPTAPPTETPTPDRTPRVVDGRLVEFRVRRLRPQRESSRLVGRLDRRRAAERARVVGRPPRDLRVAAPRGRRQVVRRGRGAELILSATRT